MTRIRIADLNVQQEKEVTIAGFVQAIRDQGSIKFLIIRDITGVIQCVVEKSSDVFNNIDNLTLESVVSITGELIEESQAPGGVEIKVKSLEILSLSEPELPIPVVVEKGGEETNQQTRIDYRWIDLRKPEKAKIFKVWTELEKGFKFRLLCENFIQIYSPTIMSTASEGGSEVFEIEYFDRKAYLAQSPQFYKQMAMSAGFERVLTFVTVYRAEPSFTTRHTTEYTAWDFEMSYIDSHHDVMDMEELAIVSGFKQVKDTLLPDLEVPTQPFPRITMTEAKERLASANVTSEKEHDLSPEEEREICKIIKKETGHDFVFIIDWHISIRPFYHMRHDGNPDLTKSFDLLYKGVEITTGSQREHRPEVLIKQAKEKGVDLESIENYVNFFRYGCPPHGGVGIAPVRIITQMLDLPNIREATFVPRDVKRLTP